MGKGRGLDYRWGFVGAVVLLTVMLVAPVGSGASGIANDAAGDVYPVTSFLDWLGHPLTDIPNASLGEYTLEQELDNALADVTQRYPQQIAALDIGGPNALTDASAFSQEMADALTHLRPGLPDMDVTDVASPQFLPDFDHNGVMGDPGDFTAFLNDTPSTGYFLYPCLSDTGAVTYETSTGRCEAAGTPGATYLEGVAQRESIVDERGLVLAATLWLPGAALRPGCPGAGDDPTGCTAPDGLAPRSALDHGAGLPTVVISDGIASTQDSYFWLAMLLASQGYVVLTYDPAGQGLSQGTAADLFSPSVPNCEFGGACRDLQDVVRWVLGDPITPVGNLQTSTNPLSVSTYEQALANASAGEVRLPFNSRLSPAYAPAGANVLDPARSVIDAQRLAVVGHSMGALSLLNYLWYQGRGTTGANGGPLPPLAAGVSLSGAAVTNAVVPIQFQTSDYDGSPTLVGPAVGGEDLGVPGNGIGYADVKPLYDQLVHSGPGTSPLSLIVLEGGVHIDFVDTPYIPRTIWSLAVSGNYASDWLNCFLEIDGAACLKAVTPIAHLSSSFASEASPNGARPQPSWCIAVPTHASLDDSPANLVGALEGHPAYSCRILN
jgi:hypothetical protein